jgi:LPXTG-motif cell wall-anchored protein
MERNMKTRAKIIVAAAALAAAAGVNAQSSVDKAFTANGSNCTQITWSDEMMAKHPKIGSACQEVLQRDGKTYVKFEGTVKKVGKGEVVMDMKGGDHITLTPQADRTVYIGGNKVAVKNLRPGDTLTFYVPEDRVVAAVMETPTAPIEEIPIAPVTETVAMTETHYDMPKTASNWPLLALLGALSLGLAGVMRTRRELRGR